MRVAAFLKGINVGGHHKVPMADLTRHLGQQGCTGIKTLLNSGNVVFDVKRVGAQALERRLAQGLEAWLGFSVAVMVRTAEELSLLVPLRPQLAPEVKSYVVFANGEPATVTWPLRNDKEGLVGTQLIGRDVLVESRPVGSRYGYSMGFLEKALKVEVSARNWNTVEKVLAALEG